jgi:hypothetical protein
VINPLPTQSVGHHPASGRPAQPVPERTAGAGDDQLEGFGFEIVNPNPRGLIVRIARKKQLPAAQGETADPAPPWNNDRRRHFPGLEAKGTSRQIVGQVGVAAATAVPRSLADVVSRVADPLLINGALVLRSEPQQVLAGGVAAIQQKLIRAPSISKLDQLVGGRFPDFFGYTRSQVEQPDSSALPPGDRIGRDGGKIVQIGRHLMEAPLMDPTAIRLPRDDPNRGAAGVGERIGTQPAKLIKVLVRHNLAQRLARATVKNQDPLLVLFVIRPGTREPAVIRRPAQHREPLPAMPRFFLFTQQARLPARCITIINAHARGGILAKHQARVGPVRNHVLLEFQQVAEFPHQRRGREILRRADKQPPTQDEQHPADDHPGGRSVGRDFFKPGGHEFEGGFKCQLNQTAGAGRACDSVRAGFGCLATACGK